jgi:hypothetical protein
MANLSEGGSIGTLGDSFGPSHAKELWERLPKQVQDTLGSIYELTDEQYFWFHRYNHINLGDIYSRRKANRYVAGTMISQYSIGMRHAAAVADTLITYSNMIFDETLSINNGVFSILGKSSSDAADIDKALYTLYRTMRNSP